MNLNDELSPSKYDAFNSRYRTLLFDEKNPPPADEPFMKVDGQSVASFGNLFVISGAPKTGKSSLCAAILAANIAQKEEGLDLLGFELSPNTDGHEVIYINTELSNADFYSFGLKVAKRAKLQSVPGYFKALNLTGRMPESLLILTKEVIDSLAAINRIRLIVIDGIGDYVLNVNDPTPCTQVVRMMADIARSHNAMVVLVIHTNPVEGGAKARGHIGSELSRKCELMLELKRKGHQVVISGKDSRNSSADFRPRVIEYDSTLGYFVLKEVQTPISKEEKKKTSDREMVERIFVGHKDLAYGELIKRIQEDQDIGVDAAKKRVPGLQTLNLIAKQVDGKYLPSTS